jgi:multicomponent Na+:H+ antiporter subunit D
VLIVSSLLNGAYFLPVITKAWFGTREGRWPEDKKFGRFETHWMLLLPPLITAVAVIVAGLVANAQISPLAWVKFVVQEYSR